MDAEDESNKNDVEMVTEAANGNGEDVNNGTGSPQAKRRKLAVCGTCLGLLEEDGWAESNATVKEVLDKKQYDSKSFGCGLSSPMCLLLREKVMCLIIKEVFPEYDENTVTSIKEAWKARHAPALARHLGLALDSGAVSALLLVLNMEYPDDIQELEILKPLSPELFQSRSRQKKRFTVEFTRRSVEQALEGATLAALAPLGWGAVKGAKTRANCVSVTCTKAPMYLGGRYIKLSRELPQTPWLVQGERMMESSVQEIIFEPLAKLCGMSAAEAEHRLKFISAGREDVDVRCLGQGRPFAVEVLDPRRDLTPEELQQICEIVSAGGRVKLHQLVLVTKDDLAQLKAGEENKCKIYEAICIKLTHSKNGSDEHNGDTPIQVTDEDISKINSFRNTPEGDPARLMLSQKTPIRVLHRRPLLNRTKYVLDLTAQKVPGHPQLLVLRIRTSAGAYVKEFVHGELRRTTPSLGDAIQAQFDILALDVTDVQLDWPVIK
ncbi:putative tRNA pseudouridine synthase Pus10 [Ostrinia furnacalis]|uniref:putative tRNA pseudouridine synthase Pus10 n=1 Tax=Ostrinia furnacalis TaxID=93504 RepID=UPI00103C5749|nr:putative tRNA pseudouridine synthase Pus10 [Ostrinia furnacalis]